MFGVGIGSIGFEEAFRVMLVEWTLLWMGYCLVMFDKESLKLDIASGFVGLILFGAALT